MSSLSKVLLVVLLLVIIHAIYAVAAASALSTGDATTVYPLGHGTQVELLRRVAIELGLTALLTAGFGVSLFRRRDV